MKLNHICNKRITSTFANSFYYILNARGVGSTRYFDEKTELDFNLIAVIPSFRKTTTFTEKYL